MSIVRPLAGIWILALSAALAVPALATSAMASSPVVLAQFFEHFDEEPQDVPPSDDPALDGLDIPGLEEGIEGSEPHLRPDMKPGAEEGVPPDSALGTKNDKLELGEVPPPFDPADRPKLLAELYGKLGSAPNAESAEPIMKTIEELWTISGSDTVDLLMSRAAQFANAAEIDLSLAILDAVVDIAPNEAEAWYLRAKVNVLQGKPERALSDLRRALSIDAKHYRAITDLGLVLEQLGAKKEALEAYRRALAVNPYLEDAQSGVDALKREVEGQDI
jgi:tetratricopeptide (TPR) repeat protein